MKTLGTLQALAIAASFTLIASSCSKQELIPPPAAVAAEAISAEKGMLRFNTVSDYENAVDQTSETAKREVIQKVRSLNSFTSVKRLIESGSRSSDTELADKIDNDYFKEMLNENLAVWIGDWIFRVNPVDEKVYVIEANKYDEKYSELIAQNTTDTDVKAYSSEMNVLDEVQNPGPQPQGLFCSESGIQSQTAGAYLTDGTSRFVHSEYNKYGIYFSLFTRIEGVSSSSPVYQFDYNGSMWDGAPHIFYHARCGSTADYSTTSTGSWGGTFFKYQSYEGSKALNKVYFYVKIRSNYPPYQELCPQFGFRKNI